MNIRFRTKQGKVTRLGYLENDITFLNNEKMVHLLQNYSWVDTQKGKRLSGLIWKQVWRPPSKNPQNTSTGEGSDESSRGSTATVPV